MSLWLSAAYPWTKSLHIISMVAWMAGLLYLPRLYVYHAMVPIGSNRSETFKIMERRLERGIMTPAMVATWGFGLLLAGTPGVVDWRMGWMWVKLAFVAAMSAFHFLLSRWRCLRRRPQQAFDEVFSDRQRAADVGDDSHRAPRRGQAVLIRKAVQPWCPGVL